MEKVNSKHTTGMLLGKFMPPHLGHQYLVDFAQNFVNHLTVLVCSLTSEPISGHLRYNWMKELFPHTNVVHVTDENPQEPHEHPEFWQIWHDSIRRVLPQGPDYVFASEDYGWKLAEILGAQYIPVDHNRSLVPVSGTLIREKPLTYWDYIPPVVRPYFVRQVCIFGPESTGKSTLARLLAQHYRTVYVSEYARGLLDFKDGRCDAEDIPVIAQGQKASEKALARQANRILFCDTDLITTCIWSDVLFGHCPEWLHNEADAQKYDLYLVTDIDVPWVDDNQRYLGHKRKEFMERCVSELQARKRPFVIINGSFEERFKKACLEVDKILQSSG